MNAPGLVAAATVLATAVAGLVGRETNCQPHRPHTTDPTRCAVCRTPLWDSERDQ